MNHWSNLNLNQPANHLSTSSIVTSTLGPFNVPQVDHQQDLTELSANLSSPLPAHGRFTGLTPANYGMFHGGTIESMVHLSTTFPNQQFHKPVVQSLFSNNSLISKYSSQIQQEVPSHIKSQQVRNSDHHVENVSLFSSNATIQDFNNICKTWNSSNLSHSSNNNSFSSLPLVVSKDSNELSVPQKEPPPAHSGNRLNTMQKNFKAPMNLPTTLNASLPLATQISIGHHNQFSAKNLTVPNNSLHSSHINNVQKVDGTNAVPKIVINGQQLYVEGFNKPLQGFLGSNNLKIVPDIDAIRIGDQQVQYISMQPTNDNCSNNVLLFDRQFSNVQKVMPTQIQLQPQLVQQTLYQNLSQVAQPASLPQYSQIGNNQNLTLFSCATSVTGNYETVSSPENSECVSVGGNSFLAGMFAGNGNQNQHQNNLVGLSNVEAVQAIADSTTKPKRGGRGAGKNNSKTNSHPRNGPSDESLDKRKNKSRRSCAAKNGNVLKTSLNVEQQNVASVGSILTRSFTVAVPPSFCQVDPIVFNQGFDSETFMNHQPSLNSCPLNPTNISGTQLAGINCTKLLPVIPREQISNSQVYLTNVFGSSFVNPNETVNANPLTITSRQQQSGHITSFGASIRDKSESELQQEMDDEFSHLVNNSFPSNSSTEKPFSLKNGSQTNKKNFLNCFVDFLQGKRQETLSSLSNIPITKKPDLPKYIPEVRPLRRNYEPNSDSVSKEGTANSSQTSASNATKVSQESTFINISSRLCQETVHLCSSAPVKSRGKTKKDVRRLRQKCFKQKNCIEESDEEVWSKNTRQHGRRQQKIKLDADIAMDGDSSDTVDLSYHNEAYDSDKDPLWCPDKDYRKSLSYSYCKETNSCKRRKFNKTLDHFSLSAKRPRTHTTTSQLPNSKSILAHKFQKGDFLLDKKDEKKVGTSTYNIWRVDSSRLLQKYEPIVFKEILLHQSSSIYSSWSENMLGNYLLLKVQHSTTRSKTVEVIELVKECNIENKLESNDSCVTSKSEEACESAMNDNSCCDSSSQIKCTFSSCESMSTTGSQHTPCQSFLQINQQKLEENLNVFIQILINQCLHPSFISTLSHEPDDYYLGPLQVINGLLKKFKEKIKKNILWNDFFLETVEQFSIMSISEALNKDMSCEATGIKGVVNVVKFYGLNYHPDDLEVNEEVDQMNSRSFVIGAATSECLPTYHDVHLIQFQLLSLCKEKVTQLKSTGLDGDSNLMKSCLQDDQWIDSMRKKFINSLKEAEISLTI